MTSPLPPTIPDQLPDFRNLGISLRVLLSINIVSIAVAVAATENFSEAIQRFTSNAALLEPALLMALALLALFRDGLKSLPYRHGVMVCVLLVLFSCLAMRAVMSSLYPANFSNYLRVVLYVFILCVGQFGYFRLRGRAMSPLLTVARLQALQARIRPHFLFNSLNAVLSLIRKEPRKAERALEDLADLFRVFMAENSDLCSLEKEVALARQYLSIESLRLGDRLRVEWHTERMPTDALIPPLTLQPLLENAVYHGIEPSITPGWISINIFRSREELHIDIRNPYYKAGGGHHAGNKMAMGNIRERLALHFDAEASLKTVVGNDYYQVHLSLPYRPVITAKPTRKVS
ncbi:sensor histidine kinase [Chitinimonas sp. BJB300]|nr:sensor histidine kinase [Chitinimonas sp. BJB300]TSJ91219.1 sensor histidine kinase [Chitinimonas sp. BJB300]